MESNVVFAEYKDFYLQLPLWNLRQPTTKYGIGDRVEGLIHDQWYGAIIEVGSEVDGENVFSENFVK